MIFLVREYASHCVINPVVCVFDAAHTRTRDTCNYSDELIRRCGSESSEKCQN